MNSPPPAQTFTININENDLISNELEQIPCESAPQCPMTCAQMADWGVDAELCGNIPKPGDKLSLVDAQGAAHVITLGAFFMVRTDGAIVLYHVREDPALLVKGWEVKRYATEYRHRPAIPAKEWENEIKAAKRLHQSRADTVRPLTTLRPWCNGHAFVPWCLGRAQSVCVGCLRLCCRVCMTSSMS